MEYITVPIGSFADTTSTATMATAAIASRTPLIEYQRNPLVSADALLQPTLFTTNTMASNSTTNLALGLYGLSRSASNNAAASGTAASTITTTTTAIINELLLAKNLTQTLQQQLIVKTNEAENLKIRLYATNSMVISAIQNDRILKETIEKLEARNRAQDREINDLRARLQNQRSGIDSNRKDDGETDQKLAATKNSCNLSKSLPPHQSMGSWQFRCQLIREKNGCPLCLTDDHTMLNCEVIRSNGYLVTYHSLLDSAENYRAALAKATMNYSSRCQNANGTPVNRTDYHFSYSTAPSISNTINESPTLRAPPPVNMDGSYKDNSQNTNDSQEAIELLSDDTDNEDNDDHDKFNNDETSSGGNEERANITSPRNISGDGESGSNRFIRIEERGISGTAERGESQPQVLDEAYESQESPLHGNRWRSSLGRILFRGSAARNTSRRYRATDRRLQGVRSVAQRPDSNDGVAATYDANFVTAAATAVDDDAATDGAATDDKRQEDDCGSNTTTSSIADGESNDVQPDSQISTNIDPSKIQNPIISGTSDTIDDGRGGKDRPIAIDHLEDENLEKKLKHTRRIVTRSRSKAKSHQENQEEHGLNSTAKNDSNSDSDSATDAFKEDDEIKFIGETGKNPLSDFAHCRYDCVMKPFSKKPESFCLNCFCFVCDVPASDCQQWKLSGDEEEQSHCYAESKIPKWKRRRSRLRNKRKRPERVLKNIAIYLQDTVPTKLPSKRKKREMVRFGQPGSERNSAVRRAL